MAHIDRVLGQFKAQEYFDCLSRWGIIHARRLIKTDLREEGYGNDALLFSELLVAGERFGIDINQNTVFRARQRFCGKEKKGYLLVADVCHLPFSNQVFDVILSTSTLDHFSDDARLVLALQELHRVIEPGGFLIIAMNNIRNLSFVISAAIEQLCGEPIRFYSMKRLRAYLTEAGFRIESLHFVVPMISPLNRFLLLLRFWGLNGIADKFARILVGMMRVMGRCVFLRSMLSWFIVFKCRVANKYEDSYR